jgi:DinB superfamily
VNVLADEGGREELQRLGARSVPVVASGGRFVFAQVLRDVALFLGLEEDPGPLLSPAALARRYERVLETALRLVRQMPDSRLDDLLPNRPRSYRTLMHHIFQIGAAFLDAEETGASLTHEALVAPPPPELETSATIADFGKGVRTRFASWWRRAAEEDFGAPMEAYFGKTSRHEVLERTVWHTAQHGRQLASLLERAGIAPDRPLGPADLAGLPLTQKIWDEE